MKKEFSMNRRTFLKTAALTGGSAFAVPLRSPAAIERGSPNERIVMGAIGLGGRGRYVLGAFLQNDDVQMVAVCDAIGQRRADALQAVNTHYGNQDCTAYIDPRELLARSDIDAVMIATGDNNHALLSVLAARAGKDIFCEKPMSVTIGESRAVADTVRRYARIFQCGTQRRNLSNFVFAIDLARSGALGRIHTAIAEKAWVDSGVHFQALEPQPEPATEQLAWDIWLGTAPWRPFNREYTTGFWRRHGDFSGGSITEWGSHTVDLCQWALDADDTMPIHYEVTNDVGDVKATYANGAKLIITKGLRFGTCPIRIEGDEGWVETGDSGEIEVHPASLRADRRFPGGYPSDNHVRDFLNCVKTRRQPRSNALASHHSISACHCANIAVRLGRPVQWDPIREEFPGDQAANRLRTRAYREPWVL